MQKLHPKTWGLPCSTLLTLERQAMILPQVQQAQNTGTLITFAPAHLQDRKSMVERQFKKTRGCQPSTTLYLYRKDATPREAGNCPHAQLQSSSSEILTKGRGRPKKQRTLMFSPKELPLFRTEVGEVQTFSTLENKGDFIGKQLRRGCLSMTTVCRPGAAVSQFTRENQESEG